MNRMIRTSFLCLLALLLCLALCACTEDGQVTAPTASSDDTFTEETPPTNSGDTLTEVPTEVPTEAPTAEAETAPPAAEDGSIRFAVLSDVHIGKANLPVSPSVKFAEALDDIHRVMGSPHAILVAGDLTDLGTDAQYQEFNAVLWDHIPGDTVVCTVMGNHEYFRDGVVRYGGESAAFLKECQEAYKGALGELHTDTVIEGMHVIGISALSSAADYTAATEFLCERVRAAAAEDPTMPIIVFSHEGFGSVYSSAGGKFTAELTKLLQEYPQIISFSGHTHYALNDPRMIRQEKITTVQTSTVGADFWNYSGMDPAQPEGRESASQGLLVTVSSDKVVTITRYDFTNDSPIGENWVIDIPAVTASRSAFTYTDTRANDAKAPAFPSGSKLDVSDIGFNGAKVSFPAAAIDDRVSDGCVVSYTVEVKGKADGAVYFGLELHADGHMGTAAGDSFTAELTGLEHGTDYVVTVTAKSAWGKVSAALTAEFTTPVDATAAPDVMPNKLLSVQYATGSPADIVSGLAMETFGTPVLKDGMAVLDKTSVYGYRLTAKEYAAMKDSLALEATLYIDPDQTYPWGYVTLIGNAEAGGYDVHLKNDGSLCFEVNVGGTYRSVSTPAPKGKWFHLVCSYDGQNLRIYINGEPVASAQCSGNVKHVAEISRIFMVGADVNGEGVPQCIANVKVVAVTLYDGGISTKQAVSLFEEAKLPQ